LRELGFDFHLGRLVYLKNTLDDPEFQLLPGTIYCTSPGRGRTFGEVDVVFYGEAMGHKTQVYRPEFAQPISELINSKPLPSKYCLPQSLSSPTHSHCMALHSLAMLASTTHSPARLHGG